MLSDPEKTIYICGECNGLEDEFALYCEDRGYIVLREPRPRWAHKALELGQQLFDEFLQSDDD